MRKVLKVLNRRRLSCNAVIIPYRGVLKKEKLKEVNKLDTFQTMKIGSGIVMSSLF